MNKNILRRIGIISVVALGIFSYLGFLGAQREKRLLNETLLKTRQNLEEIRNKSLALEGELSAKKDELLKLTERNESLSAEAGRVRQALTEKTEELNRYVKALKELEENNKGLNSQISSLSLEKDKLSARIVTLTFEKDELSKRLNSLKELRKAIKEVKARQRHNRRLVLKEENIKNLREGNRGYIVKDGESLLGTKRTVKVLPAKL